MLQEEILFSGDVEHEESDSNSAPLVTTQTVQTSAGVILIEIIINK